MMWLPERGASEVRPGACQLRRVARPSRIYGTRGRGVAGLIRTAGILRLSTRLAHVSDGWALQLDCLSDLEGEVRYVRQVASNVWITLENCNVCAEQIVCV